MNRDDICDFYLQVSKELCDGKEWCTTGISEPLQRFAALVATAEREACAALCENEAAEYGTDTNEWYVARACAVVIHARGEK